MGESKLRRTRPDVQCYLCICAAPIYIYPTASYILHIYYTYYFNHDLRLQRCRFAPQARPLRLFSLFSHTHEYMENARGEKQCCFDRYAKKCEIKKMHIKCVGRYPVNATDTRIEISRCKLTLYLSVLNENTY